MSDKINERSIDILDVLMAPLRGALALIVSPARHSQRVHRVEYLNGLSDDQLARRGLKREDIVRHVYRGLSAG